MVKDRVLPWVKDNDTYSIWDNWCIENRDLVFLNKEGNYILRINLTENFNKDYIVNIINGLLNSD